MNRGHLTNERYCGNYTTRKVHDLNNEKPDCNIDDFVNSGDDIPFDSLDIATRTGYSCCEHCIDNE